MNKSKYDLGFFSFFTLWLGAAISIAEMLTGGLLAPLGFKAGLAAIVIGHLAGTGILAMGGVIGTSERLPSIVSTGISFGSYGTYLFSILNVLQLLGWTAVMIMSGARSINAITGALWGYDNLQLWCIVLGGLICLWIYFGRDCWRKLNQAAVVLLLLLTVLLSLLVLSNGDMINRTGTGGLSFGAAIELNVIMPLSWLPLIADYTRFAKNKRSGAAGSFLGYFIGSTWMYLIGLGTAIAAGNADPGAIMLASDLGISALGIVVLSTITTTFLDAGSAGTSLLNIFPRLGDRKAALLMGVLGTLAAVAVPIEKYENFLYAIGSVFAPLFAIVITDYFIIKKRRKLQEDMLVNWSAAAVWVIGVVSYYRFIELDLVLGATIPVMLITGLLHYLSRRFTGEWILLKKQLH